MSDLNKLGISEPTRPLVRKPSAISIQLNSSGPAHDVTPSSPRAGKGLRKARSLNQLPIQTNSMPSVVRFNPTDVEETAREPINMMKQTVMSHESSPAIPPHYSEPGSPGKGFSFLLEKFGSVKFKIEKRRAISLGTPEGAIQSGNRRVLFQDQMSNSDSSDKEPSRKEAPPRSRTCTSADNIIYIERRGQSKKKKKVLYFKKEKKPSSLINLDIDLYSDSQSLNVERFDIFLEDEQTHSFPYNPNQRLIELLDKLSVRGFSLESHEPRDGRGIVLDKYCLIGDLSVRQIFYLRKNTELPESTVIGLDGRILLRSKILQERTNADYEKLLTTTIEELKLITFKIQTSNKKKAKIIKNTVLYSHVHNYPVEQLRISTDSAGVSNINAGSIDTLIEVLTHQLGRDNDFELTFIMSSDGFLTPSELFERIKNRWEQNNITAIKENTIDFFKVWLNKRIDIMADDDQLKENFMAWVENADFSNVDQMKAKGFKLFVRAQLDGKRSQYKRDIEQMLQEEYLEGAPDPIPPLHSLSMGMDIFSFHPLELARQLTLMDVKLLKKIKPHEWLQQGWMKGKSINIIYFINRFNQMSRWFASLIVLCETKEIRSTLITRFIHIAMACLTLNNYNGILEIVTALTSVACARLLHTWQLIDPVVQRHFEKLQELVSINNKFKALREAQENSDGPCIPYLGVYLGDLTFIEDGNPELTLDGLINFDKYRMVAQIILRGEQFKDQSGYKIYPINIIQNWLENPIALSEDDAFEESLKRESREDNLLLKSKLKK